MTGARAWALGALATGAAACSPPHLPLVAEAEPTEAFPTTWAGNVAEEKLAEEAEREAQQEAKERDETSWTEARTEATLAAYLGYLSEHPDGAHRDEAVQEAVALVGAMPAREERHSAYAQLIEAYPASLKLFPIEPRLLFTGPEGMRIRDIIALQDQGMGPQVIESKIRASGKPYGDFTAEELGVLQKLEVNQDVIAAMIDMTAQARKARRDEKERQALRDEIAALRKLVEEQKEKGGSEAEGSGKTVQTKDGPMDIAACMSAKLAAKQACSKLPWPASTACAEGLSASYPCDP